MAEMVMIVKALMAEGLMAELTLASQRWTVLLPLMVDKAGMVYGSETTSLHIAVRRKVRCCLSGFTRAFLLIFVVLFLCFSWGY